MVKVKNRYLLIEIIANSAKDQVNVITEKLLYHKIMETINEMHGDYGYAAVRSGLQVKVVDGDIALIRVETPTEKFVTSILPFITSISGVSLVLRTIFIGRSVRACEKNLIRIRKNELYSMLRKATMGVEKKVILNALSSISGKLDHK